MSGGGSKPGERRGGRQKGTKNKATVLRHQAAQRGITMMQRFRLSPLEVMLTVVDGGPAADTITPRQFEAAVAAAPYCHPRLAAVAVMPQPDGDADRRREVLGKLDYHARKQIEGILAAADAGIVDGVAEEVENE